MPAPTILGWCTNSFTSLQRSVHQMITGFTKTEIEDSARISISSAIHNLRGKTPAEKGRFLNYTVQSIASSHESTEDNFSPLVRTTAAVQLKLADLVEEGLRSNDSDVARCALKADWFFEGETVELKKFQNLFVVVSLRTRRGIIKKLSRTLIGYPYKAKEFYEELVKMYGKEEAMPLLKACSEEFIYEKILEYRLNLSVKTVSELFNRMPELVVKYLQLGNKVNSDNSEDREKHEIKIHEYDTFLPKLIKNYPKVFVELYSITPEKELKLCKKQSEIFMKKLKREVIANPRLLLKILSVEVVCKYLNKDQTITMIEKYFPKYVNEFNLDEMLDLIVHFHHGNKVEFLKDRYSIFYYKDLLDDENHMMSTRLQKMLRVEERKKRARFFARKYENSDPVKLQVFVGFLPPDEAIPILMSKVTSATSAEERTESFNHAVTSCSVYQSTQDLLEVMRLFFKSFQEEPKTVVIHKFFASLTNEFKLADLEEQHWKIIQDIILIAHAKKQLFVSHLTLIESVLEDTLRHLLVPEDRNSQLVEKMFEIVVEGKVSKFSPKWNVMKENRALEKKCLEKFLQLIPIKYPQDHEVWREEVSKSKLTLRLVQSIYLFNEPSLKRKPRIVNETQLEIIKIENYPWILSLTDEYFNRMENGFCRKKLMTYLKRLAPDVYESKLDQFCPIRNVDSGEALALLKRDPKKILNNWYGYLTEARKKLISGSKRAKRFVGAVRWYNEISEKFVERCSHELDQIGSIVVLGILLDGESFENLIGPLVPSEMTLNLENSLSYDRAAVILKAMKFVNPPMSFDLLAKFCYTDFDRLCEGTLASLAHRIPADKIIKYSQKLVLNRSVEIKKQAIRIIQALASRVQLRVFLEEIWMTERNPSVRFVIAKIIFENFVKAPNTKNWELIKTCIEGLTVNDRKAIEKFSDIEPVDKDYVSVYIKEYLDKIEKLSNGGMDSGMRTKCICLVMESIDEKIIKYVAEETSLEILKKYFLDTDSEEVSLAVQNFAVRTYLLRAGNKLNVRMECIMQILTTIMENFDKPSPKRAKYYAANHTIHEFFCNALTEISSSDSVKKLEVIESMLKVFNSILAPWQESWTYLSLNLYKEYLESKTPKTFGTRCANRLRSLILEFSANDLVVNDVAECLVDLISNKIFRNIKKSELKLTIIEGLVEGDEYYGLLLATKLLNDLKIKIYDERYDKIVKKLQNDQSKIILYNFYNYVNRIKPYET